MKKTLSASFLMSIAALGAQAQKIAMPAFQPSTSVEDFSAAALRADLLLDGLMYLSILTSALWLLFAFGMLERAKKMAGPT